MYREINGQIYELKEKLRIKEKLDTLRNITLRELDKKRQKRDELYIVLKKEEKDVTKLEGMSFSSIFLSMIGKKEDRLDKEREEFMAAKLRYDECLQSIKELEKELEYANKELINYRDVKQEYEKAIKEKQNLMIKEDSEQGRKLRDKLDKINEIKLDIKEVEEAIYAGERANSALSEMIKHLDSARGWGVWDMMGGGLLSNIAKHSAIDDANEVAHNSQHLLRAFEKELSDVDRFTDITVNISGFDKFADYFFDGFFVDWFVQSKINDSLDNVNSVYNKIDRIIMDLKNNLNRLESELQTNELEISKILEL